MDLQLASFLLVGIYLGLCYAQTRDRSYAALWLVAVGLVCGVKTSGLVYAPILAGGLALMLHFGGKRARAPGGPADRVDLLLVAAGICCFALVGAFWYLRNWVGCGNPIGCVELRIGSLVIFPERGPHRDFGSTTLFRLFDWRQAAHWRLLREQLWSHYCLSFVLLAALATLPFLGRDRRFRRSAGALVAAAAIALALYVVTPYSGDWAGYGYLTPEDLGGGLRYALPVVALLAITAALGAPAASVPGWALGLMAAAGAALQLRGSHWYLGLLLVGLGVGLLRALGRLSPARRRWATVAALIGCFLLGGAALFAARRERDLRRVAAYGPIVTYLDTRLAPGEAVGYFMCGKSYLCYGRDLDRRLALLPPLPLSAEPWRALLRREGISVIAFGPIGKPPDPAQQRLLTWLDSPASPLRRELGADVRKEPLVYRLKPSAGG